MALSDWQKLARKYTLLDTSVVAQVGKEVERVCSAIDNTTPGATVTFELI